MQLPVHRYIPNLGSEPIYGGVGITGPGLG
jgi:hypothetical protein